MRKWVQEENGSVFDWCIVFYLEIVGLIVELLMIMVDCVGGVVIRFCVELVEGSIVVVVVSSVEVKKWYVMLDMLRDVFLLGFEWCLV